MRKIYARLVLSLLLAAPAALPYAADAGTPGQLDATGPHKGDPGEIIEFGEVLVVSGDNVSLGTPTIAGASVAAEVIEQGRGPKIIAFKKRRRKNSRRKRGHRQEFTLVRVTEILTDGAKASKKAASRAKAKARAQAGPAAGPDAAAISAPDPGQLA